MKFLGIILSVVLASSLAMAAKKGKARHVVEEDSTSDATTTTTRIYPTTARHTSLIRRVNAQLGLSISDVTSKSTSSRTGFLVGSSVDMFKMGDLTFETGLQYRQQGFSIQNMNFNLNYLAIPILAKYYFLGETAANTMYGKAGLIPAIALSRSVSGNGVDKDFNDANSFDYGMLLGVGGKIALAPNVGLIVEADYTRGLANVVSTSDISINNINFSILSGVAFEM